MCAAGHFITLPAFFVLLYLRFRPFTVGKWTSRPSRFTLLMVAALTFLLILSCYYRPTLPERPRFGLPTSQPEILIARHGPASAHTGTPTSALLPPDRNTNPRHSRART